MAKYTEEELKVELENSEYKYGFYTDIESDTFPKGLNEEVVIALSKKKNEPQWMSGGFPYLEGDAWTTTLG